MRERLAVCPETAAYTSQPDAAGRVRLIEPLGLVAAGILWRVRLRSLSERWGRTLRIIRAQGALRRPRLWRGRPRTATRCW